MMVQKKSVYICKVEESSYFKNKKWFKQRKYIYRERERDNTYIHIYTFDFENKSICQLVEK